MKLKLLLTFMILVFIFISCRESINQASNDNPNIAGTYTEIGGNLKGTLSVSDSPFLINEDINVLSGDTFSIEPGVDLYFKENTRLVVNGTLTAEGTKDHPILFKPYSSDWLGISIKIADSLCKLKFCTIEGTYQPRDGSIIYGALEITNSGVEIRNCIFRYNYTPFGGGLCLINSNATILNNIFSGNDAELYGGAIYIQNSSASIINNTFFNNFSHNVGGAIVLSNPEQTGIQNNIFYYNYSFSSDKRLAVIAGDSTNISQQYNYLDPDSTDPHFVSGTDLHLTAESICIDSGNPAAKYNDFNGTRNDQGAYGGPGGDW
jgi:hypothetical protein